MLTFVGLGLYDERSVTLEGQDAVRTADRVVAEFYTSTLWGTDLERLEERLMAPIEVLDRAAVERHPEDLLASATTDHVAFLTAGDPMIATTHVDLRLRAADRGVETRIVHGTTAQTAASSLTGLQNYRFGRAATVPFAYTHGLDGVPSNVIDAVTDNRDRGLHTLLYLDIDAESDRFLAGDAAAAMLAEPLGDPLGVVVAQAGSPSPIVRGDRLSSLATVTFGDPLHLLVIPGSLHHMEAEALRTFAGAPDRLTESA